jgi:hypothetical protein
MSQSNRQTESDEPATASGTRRSLSSSEWLIIAFGPLFAFWLLSKLLAYLPLVFQIIVLLAWGFMLVWALLQITTESKRERLFQSLQKVGRFTPFLYSLNVLVIAIAFFGSVTYVLVEHELVRFSGLAERDDPAGALLDFYSWHFLEALPLLKVNETLHWEKPLTYDSAWVGLLLLLFKVTVIVPVIAAFALYWAHLGRNRTKDK